MNYNFTGRQGTALFSLLALLLTFASAGVNTQISAQSRQSTPTTRITEGGILTVERVMPLGVAQRQSDFAMVIDPNSIYSNVTTFTGNGVTNGGAAVVGTAETTRMLADDLTFTRGVPVGINRYRFSVANFNSVAVSARPLVRFFAADGPGGAPGTFLGGNNFNAISFPALNVSVFTSPVLGTPITLTTQTVWAGIIFDDSTVTATTAAQLNNLGVGSYNPPDRGTSADLAFLTTSAGIFTTNNPAGANINTTAIDNYGWELLTPPNTAASVSVGGRVLTSDGTGIGKTTVTITDSSGNTFSTLTSPFGYYRFENISVGDTYVVNAANKRYQFSQPQQVIFVDNNTDEVNFVAQ